jgi:hypothetical protein
LCKGSVQREIEIERERERERNRERKRERKRKKETGVVNRHPRSLESPRKVNQTTG